MKKQVTQYILMTLTIILALFSWWLVDRAIRIPEASVWLAPIIWFSMLFIIFCLDIVLVQSKKLFYPVFAAALLPGLIFVPSIWHFLVLILGFLLFLAASSRIRGDINYGKKIKLSRSLRSGKSYIFIALALIITSQYYLTVKDYPIQKVIPDFNINGLTNILTPKIISAISPNFSAGVSDDMTVDQFIVQMQNDQLDKMGLGREDLAKLPSDQRAVAEKQINEQIESNQNMLFEEGRKKFSDLAGREVSGSEKVSAIISEAINKKINNYFKPSGSNFDSLPVIPVIALVLFLTVVSLGSFLAIILIPTAAGIFRILVKLNLIKIVKIPAEVEIIE